MGHSLSWSHTQTHLGLDSMHVQVDTQHWSRFHQFHSHTYLGLVPIPALTP